MGDELKMGDLADRPAPRRGLAEKFYFAEDTGQLFVTNGEDWLEVVTADSPLLDGGSSGTLLGISKRTTTYPFVSDGSPHVLPADGGGDLGFDDLAIPSGAMLKLTLGIPQFQLGNNIVEGDDIFFEIGNTDFSEVYAAIEYTAPAAGPKYMPVMLTSVLTFIATPTLDLRVRLAVPNGRSILEAGGYEDGVWKAPAFLLAEALTTP